MKKIILADNLSISPIVHGHWRLIDWNLSNQELLDLSKQALDLGISTIDHADIYGNYECEARFGKALNIDPGFRQKIEIVTKCGIKLLSDKFPHRMVKHYDYSYDYIIESVNKSLNNFQTDYIDMLLLHRPSPFFNAEIVAKAFEELRNAGKVLQFGVSNFSAAQFELLDGYLNKKLVTNQIEISPLVLAEFKNGHLEYLMGKKIKPMAWSPLGGGALLNPTTEKGERLLACIKAIATELEVDSITKVSYAWLLKHPSGIIPVVGTGHIDRLKNAAEALAINMSLEQWFRIYIASEGVDLP